MSAIDGTFTVNDVVTQALRKSGVMGLGQSPYPGGADVLDAQNDLSDMLGQWNTETWLTWHKLDIGVVADGRAGPDMGGAYTVGPGGDFPLDPRPDRIEAAYLRLNVFSALPVDQPMRQMASMEDYSRVALKNLITFTTDYFYDSASPLGNLFLYPWPNPNIYGIHIVVKDVFPLKLPLNLDLSFLPPSMRAAMKFNLAIRLRQAYGKGLRPDPTLNMLAKKSLEVIRMSQVQVPALQLPSAVLGRGARFNIYGDFSY